MYKIVGADQKEYGPVTEDQLRQWIADGRANAQTIARHDEGPWKPLSTFPEFTPALGHAVPPSPIPPAPSISPSASSSAAMELNRMAVAGLICSILGMTCGAVCCGPLFSTLGLVFSAVGLSQINRYPVKYSGRGIAIAGVVLGVLGYVLFGLLLSKGVFRRGFRRFPRFI